MRVMLRQESPPIPECTDRRGCRLYHWNVKSSVPKRRLLTLTSLIGMVGVVVSIRHINAYQRASRITWRHSLLTPRSISRQWRLCWEPNVSVDNGYRWQQQYRQTFISPPTTPSNTVASGTAVRTPSTTTTTQLHVHSSIRDADIVEMLIGGERYSMVPMPNAMRATTIFVGNLCEFVQDSDLSNYFSQVSSLTTVPSCVVRKVNTQSMGYGFVSFPNVQEKEAAIAQFHNSEWRGKCLKVEAIRDESNVVRIPEYMVEYVYGPMKKNRNDGFNDSKSSKSSSKNNDEVKVQRISKDDVERLSRGQPSKRRGYGSRNVPHRLNDDERQELDRAARKGYLTLIGGGNRRTRKGSPLKNIHRQWCDARDCPQILLYKAVGGKAIDEVVIDLSPLRLHGLFDTPESVEDFLIRWKAQILSAAYETNMELLDSTSLLGVDDDECTILSSELDNEDDKDSERDCVDEVQLPTVYTVTLQALDQQAWATNPIWQLPVVSLGLFQGERANAKTMASALAKLWNIPEVIAMNDASSFSEYSGTTGHGPKSRRDAGASKGGHTKVKGLQEHRKRGGGHRQAW